MKCLRCNSKMKLVEMKHYAYIECESEQCSRTLNLLTKDETVDYFHAKKGGQKG